MKYLQVKVHSKPNNILYKSVKRRNDILRNLAPNIFKKSGFLEVGSSLFNLVVLFKSFA